MKLSNIYGYGTPSDRFVRPQSQKTEIYDEQVNDEFRLEILQQDCEEIQLMIDHAGSPKEREQLQKTYDRLAKEADELMGKPSKPNTAEAIWPPRPA